MIMIKHAAQQLNADLKLCPAANIKLKSIASYSKIT